MYEYKTIVQDVVPDLDVQQKLDDDLNLICQRGNWEVLNVSVINLSDMYEGVIQKVYTLRREQWSRLSWLLRKCKDAGETDQAIKNFYNTVDLFYETARNNYE